MITRDHSCVDPRDREAMLSVEFSIESFGSAASGHFGPPENYDPGSGPEFIIVRVLNAAGADVCPLLTDEQLQDLHDEIDENGDLSEPEPDWDYAYDAARDDALCGRAW